MDEKIRLYRPDLRGRGWTVHVRPGIETGLQRLHFAVLSLPRESAHAFKPDADERGLFCLNGVAIIHTDHKCFELRREDAAYIPAGVAFDVETDADELDLACFVASGKPGCPVHYVPMDVARCEPNCLLSEGSRQSEDYRVTVLLLGTAQIETASLTMGFTRGSGHHGRIIPSLALEREREWICLAWDLPGGPILLHDEGDAATSPRVICEGDLLAIPGGCMQGSISSGGTCRLLWASCERSAGTEEDILC